MTHFDLNFAASCQHLHRDMRYSMIQNASNKINASFCSVLGEMLGDNPFYLSALVGIVGIQAELSGAKVGLKGFQILAFLWIRL